jgi:transcriptional regulator with XRE-family HTH domain
MLKIIVGERLRIILGMDRQKDFAASLDESPQTINNYLSGIRFPSEDFMLKLVKIKRVNLNWFIAGEGEVYLKEQKNIEAIESIPALIGMKNLTDQFMYKVSETVAEYNKKSKELKERKKTKK